MDNPLTNPGLPLPFDRVKPEHIEPAVMGLISSAKEALHEIATGEAATYEQTFAALERATERLELSMGIVEHLESVKSSDELRAAYNAVLPHVSEFYSSIALHEGLYRALRKFAESGHEGLTPTQERYVRKTLEDFERHGAKLPPSGKERLQAIDRELSEKTTAFSQNVLDGTNAFELIVDEARLAGLPDFAKTAARESAQEKGIEGYRLTLQGPSVVPLLTYADDASLREQVWRAFNLRGRGKNDNLPLVQDILRLRRERAELLGFKNFADLATADRMAKSGEEAIEFVENLRQKTQAAFEEENASLLAFRRELEGPNAPELMPWDVSYYAEKQRKKLYDFDEEALRPYFSAPRVLSGAFELAETLYGVTIVDAELPTWDDSVRAHKIVGEDGRALGYFYTDLYPRETKRDGAWMHGLVASPPPGPHVALFCANAQPPTSKTPSLMSFRDVETVFHEFGHLLHHCLSEVSVRSLACTRVAQDFVELPSQIMENWCSEKEALDRFAKHYETGEALPEALVTRMLSARNFRAANGQMRQLGFAAVDLALHVEFDPSSGVDVNTFANEVLKKYNPSRLPDDYALIASFSHLFSHPVGYAAGYYSYKWAEVLDADAFSRFKREGLFSRSVGDAFRKSILCRGDSADPLDLFKEFMGRPPQMEPMLERQGLRKSA
jgi:oligopeptidase A